MQVVPLRRPWTWAATVVIVLAAAGVAWSVATNPAFQWPVVVHYLFDPQILAGFRRTLETDGGRDGRSGSFSAPRWP